MLRKERQEECGTRTPLLKLTDLYQNWAIRKLEQKVKGNDELTRQ